VFVITHDYTLNTAELTKWAIETKFRCSITDSSVYLVDEKDVEWFMLRWA
jgi:hypothetical protein